MKGNVFSLFFYTMDSDIHLIDPPDPDQLEMRNAGNFFTVNSRIIEIYCKNCAIEQGNIFFVV